MPINTSNAAEDDIPEPLRTSEVVYASNPLTSQPFLTKEATVPLISAHALPYSFSLGSSSSKEITSSLYPLDLI